MRAVRGGELAVTIHLRSIADQQAVIALLLAHGGTLVHASGLAMEAWTSDDTLDALGSSAAVRRVELLSRGRAAQTSEGVAIHRASSWQVAGFAGAGTRVGIIDEGFIGYVALAGREVPAAAGARCYTAPGVYSLDATACDGFSVHGTAVAETVADVAPGASIYIATPHSALDLQDTVRWMLAQGAPFVARCKASGCVGS
jgi:hypothetical protein